MRQSLLHKRCGTSNVSRLFDASILDALEFDTTTALCKAQSVLPQCNSYLVCAPLVSTSCLVFHTFGRVCADIISQTHYSSHIAIFRVSRAALRSHLPTFPRRRIVRKATVYRHQHHHSTFRHGHFKRCMFFQKDSWSRRLPALAASVRVEGNHLRARIHHRHQRRRHRRLAQPRPAPEKPCPSVSSGVQRELGSVQEGLPSLLAAGIHYHDPGQSTA